MSQHRRHPSLSLVWRGLLRVLTVVALLVLPGVRAASVARSHGGQFVVYGSPAYQSLFQESTIPAGCVRLEPELLAIGAGRVRSAILEQLRLTDRRAVPIEIAILPVSSNNRALTIHSTRYNDGWQFRLGVPYEVEETKLLKGLTHLVLIDLANHGSASGAELPDWLSEGFTRLITGSIGPAYLMQRQGYQNQETRGYDLLARSRDTLRKTVPVSFGDIVSGQPKEAVSPEVRAAAAHLMVHDLLFRPDGPATCGTFCQLR